MTFSFSIFDFRNYLQLPKPCLSPSLLSFASENYEGAGWIFRYILCSIIHKFLLEKVLNVLNNFANSGITSIFLFSFSNLYLIIFSDHPGDKGFKVWWYRRFYCIQHHTHSLTDVSDPGSIRKFVIILENLEDILQCRLCSLQTLKYLIFSSLVSEIPELVSSLCSLSNVIPLNIFTYLLLSRQHLSNVCMICLTERWKVDIPFQLQKFVQSNQIFLKKNYEIKLGPLNLSPGRTIKAWISKSHLS